MQKAVHHLVGIEYREIFTSSTWYEKVTELFDTNLENSDDHDLVTCMLAILTTHQVKFILQSVVGISPAVDVFSK